MLNDKRTSKVILGVRNINQLKDFLPKKKKNTQPRYNKFKKKN